MPTDHATAPRLATVNYAAKEFESVGQTTAAIRAAIFKADERLDPRGAIIPGNGLGATGAIIRRRGRVLVDLDLYGAWLAGR